VSHLASVGFQRSEGDAKELISTAVDRATEVVEHADGKTATYRDPSGATLTVHLSDEGDLHCVKPGFEGDSRARWRPVAVTRDPECRFCDFVCAELLEEDEPVYPFVLSVVTIGSDRDSSPTASRAMSASQASGKTGSCGRTRRRSGEPRRPSGATWRFRRHCETRFLPSAVGRRAR
jgi:hypothetical protein